MVKKIPSRKKCKKCGKRYVPKGQGGDYCLICQQEIYGRSIEPGNIYYPEDEILGLGPEQTKRYFRKYAKEGFSALPEDWRRMGVQPFKSGRRWTFILGCTEEEVKKAKLFMQILNELFDLVPKDIFSKRMDYALNTFGLYHFLSLACLTGYDVLAFRDAVAREAQVPQDKRITAKQLREAMKTEVMRDSKLAKNISEARAIMAKLL